MKTLSLLAFFVMLTSAVIPQLKIPQLKMAQVQADETQKPCFESRKGASEISPTEIKKGQPSIKCSPKTNTVLWWGDPYVNTVPMGKIKIPGDYDKGEAVVRPRTEHLQLYTICGVACHNGVYPPYPKDKNPRKLTMHQDVVPDALNLQHGRGGIWCLDCHDAKTRNKLVDNFGNLVSFNEPQKLCGKCHGSIYKDWRSGIHGKRTGQWDKAGKKRWFVCTECHNPHDVQNGARQSGFKQIEPEMAPRLPKGVDNFDYELKDADGNWRKGKEPKKHKHE